MLRLLPQPLPPARRGSLALAVAIATAAPLFAQDQPERSSTAELDALRTEFQRRIHTDIAPAANQYIAQLERLERQLAADGNYEAAIATRTERAAAEAFLRRTADAPPPSRPQHAVDPADPDDDTGAGSSPVGLALRLDAATFSGGASFSDDVLHLSRGGAQASWPRAVLEPGGYDVVITYVAERDTPLRAHEGFFRRTTTLPSSPAKPVTHALGNLKITDTSTALTLVNQAREGTDTGLLIHQVQIVPEKD